MNRTRVILRLNRYSVSSVLGRAYAINNGMAAHPARYTDPNPSLAVLQGQIKIVEEATQRAKTGEGTVFARNVERDNLTGMLETERAYVQTLCDKAPPGQAAAIAHEAGMEIAVVPTRVKPILDATAGAASGSAMLEANATLLAGKRGKLRVFNWQWTTDGGQTFHDALSTAHARTAIANLPPLSIVGFRVSVTDRSGPGAWSQVVSIRVS